MTWDKCDVTDAQLDLDAFAGFDVDRAQSEAAGVVNGVGRFWQIEATNGAVSYLWGTIHSNHPFFLKLDPAVEAQIKAARVVALEFDPITYDRKALTELNTRRDIYVPNNNGTWSTTKINDILGPKRSTWVDGRLLALGFQAGSAPFLRIDALAEALIANPCNDFALGLYPIQDSYIQMLGATNGAVVLGLENAKSFRTKLSNPKNRALTFDLIKLYSGALDPDITPAQHQSWAGLWKSGQTGLGLTLEREILRKKFGDNRGPDMQGRVDAYLLNARNVTFADTAEAELQKGGVFMAVGASHIAGEAGMVALLQRRGYRVTRIPLPHETP